MRGIISPKEWPCSGSDDSGRVVDSEVSYWKPLGSCGGLPNTLSSRSTCISESGVNESGFTLRVFLLRNIGRSASVSDRMRLARGSFRVGR